MKTLAQCKSIRYTEDGYEVSTDLFNFVSAWLKKGLLTKEEINEVIIKQQRFRKVITLFDKWIEMMYRISNIKFRQAYGIYEKFELEYSYQTLHKDPSCMSPNEMLEVLEKFLQQRNEDPNSINTYIGHQIDSVYIKKILFSNKEMVLPLYSNITEKEYEVI